MLRQPLRLLILLALLVAACGTEPEPTPTLAPDPPAPSPTPEPFTWSESAPDTQGLDADKLAEIPIYIEQSASQVNSVLVVRNGEIVYEEYFGRTADTTDQVWSVTKSVVSTLIGIAIDEGLIGSVDQPLSDFYSADQLAASDPQLSSVTLRDLLTMSSGMSCGNDACHNSTIADSLARELNSEPGSDFVYDTGASHLLAGVLENATGMGVAAYAEAKLFEPLAFDTYPWDNDSDGTPFGGKGLQLKPRDMAKFGLLFLNDGMWMGERLISAEFIAESTTSQVETGQDVGYGYLWWLDEVDGYETYAAVGYGGQFVHVVPELELVTVLTSSYFPLRDNSSTVIESFVVPAVTTP